MKIVHLLDDEWTELFRLASQACASAAKEMHHGRQANYGMGQGTVQRQQQEHYDLLVRCVVALNIPK